MSSIEREQRFSHLLQPIRELAANWSIDIATSLEDYLEELENVNITLEGGEANLNFAEAALLIQGSTCIYSRKVEHLYALVLQTIEHLTNQHHSWNAAGGSKAADDGSGDAAHSSNEDTVFLLLDDQIEKGADIDLPAVCVDDASNGGRSRVRKGASGSGIDRPPLFLLEQDHGSTFRMSTCKVDASGALMIEGAQSFTHALDRSSSAANSSAQQQQQGSSSTELDAAHTASEQQHDAEGEDAFDSLWTGFADAAFTQSSCTGAAAEGSGSGMDCGDAPAADYDGFDGGHDGGGYSSDDSDGAGGDAMDTTGYDHSDSADAAAAAAAVTEPSADAENALEQEVPPLPSPAASVPPVIEPVAVVQDPWAPLDPHDPGSSVAKPWKKGRTCRVPPELKLTAAAAAAKAAAAAAKGGKKGSSKKGTKSSSSSGMNSVIVLHVPLAGLAYPEFRYLQQAQLKRRRQRSAMTSANGSNKTATSGGFAPVRSAGSSYSARSSASRAMPPPLPRSFLGDMTGDLGGLCAGDYDHDDYDEANDGGTGIEGANIHDDGNQWFDAGGDGYNNDNSDSDDDDGGGYNGYDDYSGGGGGSSSGTAPMSLADAFRDAPQTYEDLCRSHIQAFMRGAEQYAAETHLSRRVNAWQSKLEPLLRAQSERRAFDMRACGDAVLARAVAVLPPAARLRVQAASVADTTAAATAGAPAAVDKLSDDAVVPFGTVVAGRERYDVCRIFLASLQLANSGSVVLLHGSNAADQSRVPFQMRVVRTQAAREVEGYFAPSVTESEQLLLQQQHQSVPIAV